MLVVRPAGAQCPRIVSIGAKFGGLQVAERCLHSANDLSGLLLLTSARGDVAGLRALVESAEGAGRLNVAFLARFLLGDLTECVSPPSIWHHCGEYSQAHVNFVINFRCQAVFVAKVQFALCSSRGNMSCFARGTWQHPRSIRMELAAISNMPGKRWPAFPCGTRTPVRSTSSVHVSLRPQRQAPAVSTGPAC